MNVVARQTLIDFWGKYPKTKALLQHWLNVTKAADWKSTQSVVGTFSKAKGLNSERVRFEVACGEYRMIVAFDFRRQMAFIKFIGTRHQYVKVDAKTVSLF
jgi:mRNA interferase HigB